MRKGLPFTNVWLAFWITNYCSVEPVVNVHVLVNFLLSKFVHWTRFTLDFSCYKLTYGGLLFISEPFLYSWNEQLKVPKKEICFLENGRLPLLTKNHFILLYVLTTCFCKSVVFSLHKLTNPLQMQLCTHLCQVDWTPNFKIKQNLRPEKNIDLRSCKSHLSHKFFLIRNVPSLAVLETSISINWNRLEFS